MFCSYTISNDTRKLIKINHKKYITLLNSYLLPSIAIGETFQHDGSPYNISYATKKFLTNKDMTVLQD